jgi:hypothetical protein
MGLERDADVQRVRVQVDCWGKTHAEVHPLAGQVEGQLSRFSGMAGGVEVLDTLLDQERESYESDTQLRRVSHDLYFLYEKGRLTTMAQVLSNCYIELDGQSYSGNGTNVAISLSSDVEEIRAFGQGEI